MGKKRCKRKVWKLLNPIQHAIDGARVTSDELLNELRVRELADIELFRTGQATSSEWAGLCALLNVCETMARGGIGPEAMVACKAAEQALIEAGKHYERTKRMVTSGPGLQALRDLYEYHDLQRQSVSRSEYEKWIKTAENRTRSKAPEVRDMAEI